MDPKNELELRKALKQLKKEVLLKDALALFPLVSLEELTSEIRRLKYSTNEASIIDVLIDLLKEKQISDEEIQEQIPLCNLLGVSLNSSRKTWTTYTLLGDDPPDFMSSDEVNSAVKHQFLQNNVHASVTTMAMGSIYWIQVVEKKLLRTHRLITRQPVYIGRYLDEPYLFVSKREVSEIILQSISEAFGFHGFKFSSLNGRDLDSLLKHLSHKGLKRGSAAPIPPFNCFEKTSIGKDFSQHEKRRQYITDLMGPSPPKLSNYVVIAKNLPWRGRLDIPTMHGVTFDMKIEFKTDDTVEMIKDMAEDGILKVPPPGYVKNLLSTGRNNIKLRVQGGTNGASETDNQTDA